MEDIVYDPLERYKSEYRDRFLQNAQDAFEDLSDKANIDKEANRQICGEIAQLSESKATLSSSHSRYSLLRIVCWTAVAVLVFLGAISDPPSRTPLYFVPALAVIVFNFAVLNRKIRKLKEEIDSLEENIRQKKAEAFRQMEPLNALFDWDIPARLIEKTVPKLHFDRFFTQSRIDELVKDFGYDGSLNENASVLFSQSGEINGNPFVIADLKTFEMGEKTYTGHKTIHWTETVTGFDGKRHRVFRSQTLSASVTKPCPAYGKLAFVLYGNDAAPNLTFTRKPSGLTEDGFFQNYRRKQKLRELQKFSRNLQDESQYTLMGNREFETLFETKDRNDEVEYRLLFTALAQRQMLSLLKEKINAYGDDFSFFKAKKVNVIVPGHLNDFNLDTNPNRFAEYSYKESRHKFIRINQEYFRAVYFSMAPLLCIPLYQQIRTQREIYGNILQRSSFWEWESIANFYGEEKFRHPKCATDCILKTEARSLGASESTIRVTAHGYSGTPRIDYVPVLGGDGRTHNVPVKWIEYDPVSRTREISIQERTDRSDESPRKSDLRQDAGEIFRRGIFAKI